MFFFFNFRTVLKDLRFGLFFLLWMEYKKFVKKTWILMDSYHIFHTFAFIRINSFWTYSCFCCCTIKVEITTLFRFINKLGRIRVGRSDEDPTNYTTTGNNSFNESTQMTTEGHATQDLETIGASCSKQFKNSIGLSSFTGVILGIVIFV